MAFPTAVNQSFLLFWEPPLIHDTQFSIDLSPVLDSNNPFFGVASVARMWPDIVPLAKRYRSEIRFFAGLVFDRRNSVIRWYWLCI